jgi:hypothetical protein
VTATQVGTPPREAEQARAIPPGRGRLLSWIIVGYPVWWALGLGVLIFLAIAPLMAIALVKQHRAGRKVALPPGFAWWLAFLALAVASVAALGVDPEGTVPDTAGGRMLAVLFRLGEYGALTLLLLYVGNRRGLTNERLVKLLAWLFVVTVAGGLLGTFAGTFEFTSPVELLLPGHIRSMGFVQSLVHPQAAQVMELIGDPQPRPAAPWGYTNTWGNNFCLLVVWFVALYWGGLRTRGKTLAAMCLVLATIPVVYSLNRGLWIGLGVVGCYVAVRMAMRGRLGALTAVVTAGLILGATLVVTPLGDVVSARLDNGKSNGVRMYLTERAVTGVVESPLIGFGSTRSTWVAATRSRWAPRAVASAAGTSPSAATANCGNCCTRTGAGNRGLSRLLRLRAVAVPARPQRDRHRRFGRDRGEPRRDVLVQRAGHAAGLDPSAHTPCCGGTMPVRTAPANLSAAEARLRAEYVREVLAVLYPEPDEAVPGHRVRADSRRAPAAAAGAGRRAPGGGGRRRALCRAAEPARAAEARRRRGGASHRRLGRAAARPGDGTGRARHHRDVSPRRAGHRHPARCPHRTGAGQPQAGAAGAHPRPARRSPSSSSASTS